MQLGQGGITRLYDKTLQKEVFNTTAMVAGDLFHMGYDGNGAGEFVQVTEPNYGGMERAHEKESTWHLIESGAVYSKFDSEYKMKGFSVSSASLFFIRKSKLISNTIFPIGRENTTGSCV